MLKLTIETTNAAFDDEPATEIARILRNTAEQIEEGNILLAASFRLYDLNGNIVGRVEISE